MTPGPSASTRPTTWCPRTIGNAGDRDWGTGIGRTSPSITSEPNNGFEVAVYPSYLNQMWILGTAVNKVYNISRQPGNTTSSPAITH